MTKESQNIEWKQSWHDDYLKWICGFANAQGGRVFIGKDDAGKTVGLENAKKLLEDLPNKIRDQLGLMPHINLLKEEGKDCLEIIVEPSTVPISLRGSYYWRSGAVKQELKGDALTNFLLKKTGMTWDRVVEKKATLNDIDDETIEMFKEEALTSGRLLDISRLSTKDLLKKLRLFTREGLTNASLVLFGKDPGEFYPNPFVKIGRFGKSVVDMRFQEVSEGNLFQMLHDVMEQLERKFLIKPVRFEGLRRIEELEYPVPALREILLNALVHRNYMGSMTQLKVMDDRLSLWNAGTLPSELTIEKLFQVHESLPRNPLIADVCYKAGYIDSWGRGVEKISEACERAGLPAPRFEERSGGVAVELVKTPASQGTVSEKIENYFELASGKHRESVKKTPVETPDAILATLKSDYSLTLAEVAERIGKSVRAVERAAKKLSDQGRLKYVGPKKGGHWEVLEP